MHLVHRDVSPHNLLVSMDGRVKVVDFGIAKATGRRSSTRTGQLRGKLAYMSPEQASGGTIDLRTDLFALGAVLWELLTNERLFNAETESETLARVTACEVPDILTRRSDLPAGVAALVSRALAREPKDRFATAQDMLREVRQLLRALGPEVEPRADLGEVMERLFAARVAYVRAAVRRAGESGPPRERAANDPIAPEDATRASERAAERSSASGQGSRSSGSQPLVAGPHTHTHTLTASLASAPARHWSLWLVLPLVGAVVGAAMVSQGFGRSDEPVEGDAVRRADPRPTMASVDEAGSARTMAVASTVKWRFDTEPPGATIVLDGKPYPERSPVTIEVPRSDEPINVVISLEGYAEQRLNPAPLGPGNFNPRLEPLPDPVPSEPAAAGVKDRRKGGTWLSARSKKTPTDEGKQTDTDATKPPGDGRELPPQPDFASIKVKGTQPRLP